MIGAFLWQERGLLHRADESLYAVHPTSTRDRRHCIECRNERLFRGVRNLWKSCIDSDISVDSANIENSMIRLCGPVSHPIAAEETSVIAPPTAKTPGRNKTRDIRVTPAPPARFRQ